MRKLDEMAAKVAVERFPDSYVKTSFDPLYPYGESEVQSIKQDAFAEGYRRAIEDLYQVIKPEDLQNGLYYWNSDSGGLDWAIGFVRTRSYSTPLLCVHGHDYPVMQTDLLRGPILNPSEVGIVGGEW